MKLIATATLFFCFHFSGLYAQDSSLVVPEYGKVEPSDLQSKECSFYPGADAINLLKYKEAALAIFPSGNTEVTTVTRNRIKIYSKRAYKRASVDIPFYDDKSIKLISIKAATYNLGDSGNIKVSTLSQEEVYKVVESKNGRRKSIKFTFPDVKEGSVLEYEIAWRYKFSYGIPTWYFQDDMPSQLTVYKVNRPLGTELGKRIISGPPIMEKHLVDVSNGYDKRELLDLFIVRDVPPFKRESFMSSPRDYEFRIDFLVNPGRYNMPGDIWGSPNSWLLRAYAFGGTFDSKIPGTKPFIDSVKRLNNVSDQIRSVHAYVRKNIKWNHVYYKFSRDLDEVWKDGQGTSAEINLSILNLLRKCNVRSFPVLYSTRGHGQADFSFPDISQFNTVNVAAVNGNKFNLVDGTSPWFSYDTPPFTVVDRSGLMVDADNDVELNIQFEKRNNWDSIFVSAAITPDGTLQGKVVQKYFDLAKSIKLAIDEDEEEEDPKAKLIQKEEEIKSDTVWQLNVHDEMLPLIENRRFHYELPGGDKFYFFNPFLFSNLPKNPFSDSARISDIDFGAPMASYLQISIALPGKIKVEELPPNKEIYSADSLIVFKYQNELRNDSLLIRCTMQISQAVFEKKSYPLVKTVFEKIYGLSNNQMLLRKEEK